MIHECEITKECKTKRYKQTRTSSDSQEMQRLAKDHKHIDRVFQTS